MEGVGFQKSRPFASVATVAKDPRDGGGSGESLRYIYQQKGGFGGVRIGNGRSRVSRSKSMIGVLQMARKENTQKIDIFDTDEVPQATWV